MLGLYEQLLIQNYRRGIVVALLDREGTDVSGGCDQCGAF